MKIRSVLVWFVVQLIAVGFGRMFIRVGLQPPTIQPTDAKAPPKQVGKISQHLGSIESDRVAAIITIAFLRTTAYAEGTYTRPGIDAYRTQALSYRQIPETYAYKDHPYWHDKIIPCTGTGVDRLCSACTGAYQFHPDTFDTVRRRHIKKFWYPEGAFSPKNQDLAAIYLMDDVGVWKALERNAKTKDGKIVVDRSSFVQALGKGAHEWASFPKYDGDTLGHHGQGSPGVDRLWNFFRKQIEDLSKL